MSFADWTYVIPVALALAGVFLGRQVAIKMGTCPHRGKVYGALLTPLTSIPLFLAAAKVIPVLTSLGALVGAGLTAHSPLKTMLMVILVGAITGLSAAVFLLQH